jgi:hypothetical protein
MKWQVGLNATLIALIPIFVAVTMYSRAVSQDALDASCENHHRLVVHETAQRGLFQLIEQRLQNIDDKLEKQGLLLEDKLHGGGQ